MPTVLGCLPWLLALALLGDAVGQNWKQWKDHLSYVDYAIAISTLVAWVILRARRATAPEAGE